MKRRWTVLAGTAAAALVAAGLAGVVLNRLASSGPNAPLQLQNISQSSLQRAGLRLTAAQAPVYCAISDTINNHGWNRGGVADCPISKQTAEKAAGGGGSSKVLESALARASWPQNQAVGENRLVWVFVLAPQSPRGPTGGGAPLGARATIGNVACPVTATSPGGNTMRSCVSFFIGPRLTLVDAQTGSVVYQGWGQGYTPTRPHPLPPVTGTSSSVGVSG
jgi:hypothetical protein